MRCLFIGGKLAGKVLSVTDGIKYVENPVPFKTGRGSERYVVGEITNAAGTVTPICYLDGTDPLEVLLNHYENNAQR